MSYMKFFGVMAVIVVLLGCEEQAPVYTRKLTLRDKGGVNTIEVRIVHFEGHEYVMAEGNSAGPSICHHEGCPCRSRPRPAPPAPPPCIPEDEHQPIFPNVPKDAPQPIQPPKAEAEVDNGVF